MKMNEIKVRAAIAALPECIRKVEHPIGIVDMGEYDRLVSEMTNHAASMAVRYTGTVICYRCSEGTILLPPIRNWQTSWAWVLALLSGRPGNLD